MSSSDDYAAAKARYARIRHAAFTLTETDAVRLGISPRRFRLTDLDEAALTTWRRTWIDRHPTGSGGWDWDVISRPFRKNPAAFHLALWSGPKLCGLSVGSLSRKRPAGEGSVLCIHYIESAPARDHPMKGKVALIVLTAAEAYAWALGVSILRVSNPLDGALPIYLKLGFSVARDANGAVYCEKRLGGEMNE
ncbi:MAG TPA: hypothetical protein VF541_20615 [Longimicrobium sp.]|jgi:hypothetical protein